MGGTRSGMGRKVEKRFDPNLSLFINDNRVSPDKTLISEYPL